MEKRLINLQGNWDYWTEAQKNELHNAKTNTHIGYKLVFENEHFRIWTIHLNPNERLPFHRDDKKYFWTALSNGKGRSYFDDGSVVESIYENGDTKFYENLNGEHSFIHNLENIGHTTLIFSTVEFKTKL